MKFSKLLLTSALSIGAVGSSMNAFADSKLVAYSSTKEVNNSYNQTDSNGARILSPVPAIGIHPRVIFSPEDIQPWRENVVKSEKGKAFFAKRYNSKYINELSSLPESISDEELVKMFEKSVNPGLNHEFLYATMDAVYHDDDVAAQKVCKAATNFAKLILARKKIDPKWGKYQKNIGDIKGNDGIGTDLGALWYRGGADYALTYDMLYNKMSKEQQDLCRKALSTATKELICWGMNFPEGRAISNWYGYHGELGVMLLAIEGEDGFNEKEWISFKKMIKDWLNVHFYVTGGSNEDGYTINTSLREGQFTMLAMAKRGDECYNAPQLRNYFKWLALSLVPGEESGVTVGYSSNRAAPYESSVVLARWAMPEDPYVNYYFRQFKGPDYKRNNKWQYGSWSTLLGMNWDDSKTLPLDMSKLNLPVSTVFPYQGLFITRSDWSNEAAYLNVLGRQDAWYDRHENVDRGRFVFAALGRRWAVDRPWALAIKGSDHSIVHIDGKSQAEFHNGGRGKAPNANLIAAGEVAKNGRMTSVVDNENVEIGSYSGAIFDLSNAYNWTWMHSWKNPGGNWTPETRSFEEIGWKWTRPGQPKALYGADSEEAPQYNFQGLNLWKQPYNPVNYNWRSTFMMREKLPFALIVDDVESKDGKVHNYDWYMQIDDGLKVDIIDDKYVLLTEEDVKLVDGKPAKNSRQLLVIPSGEFDKIKFEKYVASHNSKAKTDYYGKRLVISYMGKEMHLRVALLPYRTTNSTLDDWKKYPLGADIKFESEDDSLEIQELEIEFEVGKDGRTRLKLDD